MWMWGQWSGNAGSDWGYFNLVIVCSGCLHLGFQMYSFGWQVTVCFDKSNIVTFEGDVAKANKDVSWIIYFKLMCKWTQLGLVPWNNKWNCKVVTCGHREPKFRWSLDGFLLELDRLFKYFGLHVNEKLSWKLHLGAIKLSRAQVHWPAQQIFLYKRKPMN